MQEISRASKAPVLLSRLKSRYKTGHQKKIINSPSEMCKSTNYSDNSSRKQSEGETSLSSFKSAFAFKKQQSPQQIKMDLKSPSKTNFKPKNKGENFTSTSVLEISPTGNNMDAKSMGDPTSLHFLTPDLNKAHDKNSKVVKDPHSSVVNFDVESYSRLDPAEDLSLTDHTKEMLSYKQLRNEHGAYIKSLSESKFYSELPSSRNNKFY
jgi:hypothetical protein